MKGNLLISVIFIAALAFTLVSTGCEGKIIDGGGDDPVRDRVTITFALGYSGGTVPAKVTILKGGTVGNRWPANPRRSGFLFEGWYSGETQFFRSTVINEDVTVTAVWDEMTSAKDSPSTEALAVLFDPTKDFPATLSDARKIWGMNNPIITFAYLADPAPMVFCHAVPPCILNSGDTEKNWCDECVLYLYGSNDTLRFTDEGEVGTNDFAATIQGLRVVSTKDLVNWTEHGPLNFVGKTSTHPLFPSPPSRLIPSSYANDTWAPTAQWKMVDGKPRFFLYWCNSGNNTSVVISDESPVGPFNAAGRTSPMIPKSSALGTNGVSWLFDPGSLIVNNSDGTSTAYMVLGGDGSTANPGNARRVMLADDMISLGENIPQAVNLPWHYEATDIWKWKGIYYLNYTSNWSAGGGSGALGLRDIDIVYMMNKEGPMGEFPIAAGTWGGPKRLLPNSVQGGGDYGDSTNHASLFDFKGKTYIAYHTQSQSQAYGGGRLRVAHIAPLPIKDDGSIDMLYMGLIGAPQDGDLDPYAVNEAETVAVTAGVYTKYDETASNGICIASIDSGDWLGMYGVNFDLKPGGAAKFNAIIKIDPKEGAQNRKFAIELRINPQQQGISNPQDNTRLSIGTRTRITGGNVIGRIQFEVEEEDLGKWVFAATKEPLPNITGKHNLAFVFYSSDGAALEHHTAAVTPATDARRRDAGFSIDQWWFD